MMVKELSNLPIWEGDCHMLTGVDLESEKEDFPQIPEEVTHMLLGDDRIYCIKGTEIDETTAGDPQPMFSFDDEVLVFDGEMKAVSDE